MGISVASAVVGPTFGIFVISGIKAFKWCNNEVYIYIKCIYIYIHDNACKLYTGQCDIGNIGKIQGFPFLDDAPIPVIYTFCVFYNLFSFCLHRVEKT